MNYQLKDLIRWWEGKNRLRFNLYMFGTGTIGLFLLKVFHLPLNAFIIPLILFYAIVVNIFYTSIWIILFLATTTLKINLSQDTNKAVFYLALTYTSIFNILFPVLSFL